MASPTNMKLIFFCGNKSRYGIAHLQPILSEFNVVAVVIPTEKRWDIFREALSGKRYDFSKSFLELLFLKIKQYIKYILLLVQKIIPIVHYNYSVRHLCKKRNIPVIVSHDVNDKQFIDYLHKIEPDLIMSAAYPQIFNKELLSVCKRAAINFHPSLLPMFRGAHPHFWCIAKGAKFSGITAHLMTENIDDGDILVQIKFPIKDLYYNELYNKIVLETPCAVKKVREVLNNDNFVPCKQDKINISSFRNDRDIHKRIFWNINDCEDIFNLIRTEAAFSFFGRKKVVFKRASIVLGNRNMTNKVRVEPGTIIDINDKGIVVSTIDENKFLIIHNVAGIGRIISFQRWIKVNRAIIGNKFC